MSLVYCSADKANSDDNTKISSEQNESYAKSESNDDKFPMAPDFTLKDVEGNPVSLSDYKGKVVFVNFWATWCPPCRAEIPHFIELVDKYPDDFIVLGVDLDPRDFSKVPAFVEQQGMNYPVLYDTEGVSNIYGGISSIPTTFVVNRNGKKVDTIVGSRPKAVFEEIIKKWL
jgi:thiol-disulfide isomerase/thioredoxin